MPAFEEEYDGLRNFENLRVALIGTGGIGVHHLKMWSDVPQAHIVGVFDTNRESAEKAAKEHGIETVFASLDDALELEEVDAVDICTPNAAHLPTVKAALQAGKHCLCEKPLAANAREIEQMIALRDRSGKLLMTAQHLRFDERSLAFKKMVEVGRLGDIYYGRAWWLRRRMAPAWSAAFIDKSISGGGPCVDIGVHVLDLSMHFMGFPLPVSVSGIAPCRIAKRPKVYNKWGAFDSAKFGVEDFAAGLVRFENGAMLSLEVSWMFNIEEEETSGISLFGDEGGGRWPELRFAYEEAELLMNSAVQNVTDGHGHRNELRAFVDAVRTGGPSPVPAEESLTVARVLDGLYQSSESGHEVRL